MGAGADEAEAGQAGRDAPRLAPPRIAAATRIAERARLLGAGIAATFEGELEEGRGVLWLPVFFGAGIAAYFALPAEPSLAALAAAALALLAAAWRTAGAPAAFRLLLPLAMVAAGASLAKLRTDLVAAPRLERATTGEVTGWIERLDHSGASGARLLLRVAAVEDLAPEETPPLVRITVRSGAAALAVGDGVAMLAALRPPLAPLLPGGHDFGRVDYYAGIGGSGFAYGAARPAELGPPPLGIRLALPLARLRALISSRIEAALPGEPGRIAVALITGDQGGISEATQDSLRASGLAHILSISGLHMVLVAGAVFWVSRALLALVPALALRRPIKKWAAGAALLVGAGYLVLSGAAVPAQRSYLMIAIMYAAVLFDRRAITVRNVALSAFLVLLLSPESLLSASFQMSFAAALALVSAYEAITARRAERLEERSSAVRGRVRREVSGLFLTSLIAGLATAPFAAFHFQRVAPLSLLANMAAMPAVSFVVMPAALATVLLMPLGLEALPLALMKLGLAITVAVSDRVAGWSASFGAIPAAPTASLLLTAAGFLWLALWRRPWRLTGLAGLAGGLAVAVLAPRPDMLVAADGRAAMVRAEDGRYRLLGGQGARYQTDTWLRADGDPRDSHAEDLADAVLCDPLGCTAPLAGGGRAALTLRPEALADDCAAAAIVVTGERAPARCGEAALPIDARLLGTVGAVALHRAGDGSLRIEGAYDRPRRPFDSPLPLAAEAADATVEAASAEDQ